MGSFQGNSKEKSYPTVTKNKSYSLPQMLPDLTRVIMISESQLPSCFPFLSLEQ
jgi:hypothetical protein